MAICKSPFLAYFLRLIFHELWRHRSDVR